MGIKRPISHQVGRDSFVSSHAETRLPIANTQTKDAPLSSAPPFKKVRKNRDACIHLNTRISTQRNFLRRHYPHQVIGSRFLTASQPIPSAPLFSIQFSCSMAQVDRNVKRFLRYAQDDSVACHSEPPFVILSVAKNPPRRCISLEGILRFRSPMTGVTLPVPPGSKTPKSAQRKSAQFSTQRTPIGHRAPRQRPTRP